MKFVPKSEDDLKREQLCPEGLQPFTVLTAVEKQSTTGKDMIALKLNVHADDGFDYHIYDYISAGFMPHKLRHFAAFTGLLAKYEAGSLSAEDCQARQGWCDVGQKKGDGTYGPKNVIKDYFSGDQPKTKEPIKPKAPPADQAAGESDEVPF